MDVQLYIKNASGNLVQLDLFNDEKVEINLNVKNLSDISKIRSDFSQPFTVPCSPTNNSILQYWYDADVDGTFNANIRVDAYIEVNSAPFRFGSIQLDNCKLKNNQPYSYSITFFGAGVNLSDKFGDDYLKDLDLSAQDHSYSSTILGALSSDTYGDNIYYPLINATSYMDYGSGSAYDLKSASNTITYRDFKPAIRLIKLIEAIESKYNVTFSRDFFSRSIFHNLFMWLHKEQGQLVTTSENLQVNFDTITTNTGDWTPPSNEINLTNNSVAVKWIENTNGHTFNTQIQIVLRVTTSNSNKFNVTIYDNGQVYNTINGLVSNGNVVYVNFYKELYKNDPFNHNFTFDIATQEGTTSFTTELYYNCNYFGVPTYPQRTIIATSSSQTTANSMVKISEQIPELKVKDFFTSLVNQFNLILKPIGVDSYYVDTLDNWYNNGKTYDISGLVDIKDITVKRPSVKKRIDFLYQKTETILAKQYYDNNLVGYGDLKATYNITGEELKIESQFENMMFERLVDVGTSTTTALQCGFSVDKNNNPIKGKPFVFYRNGVENATVKIGSNTITPIWHTASEDNITYTQVTSSVNFGADISTYFYQAIDTGLYFNFWKSFIDDLYDKKTRVLQYKCKLPVRILQSLGLNDRFIIGDNKYKISSVKVDLTTCDADIEVFSDLGNPIDSIDNIYPLTIDTTAYTLDSELITLDMVSIHDPITSYIANGVSMTEYNATKGAESFEIKVDANTVWTASCQDGDWVTLSKTTGKHSDFIRVDLKYNYAGTPRTSVITITIGTTDFTIDISQ